MALGNGLHLHEDLDSRMQEYVENIRYLTSEISEKNKEISSADETLNDLRSDGLATSELEESFSRATQNYLKERAELEQKRETILETATSELNEAKEKYNQAVQKIDTSVASQAKEVLSSIRERVTELGEWEQELQDAMDDQTPSPTKRLTLRR